MTEGKIHPEKQPLADVQLRSTLLRMASVLGADLSAEPISSGIDELFKACAVIARWADVTLVHPADMLLKSDKSIALRLAEMCDPVGLQYRDVELTGSWWQGLVNPLLVFQGATQRPMAILPSAEGQAVLIDPQTGLRRQVDATLAAHIAWRAYAFYPQLPTIKGSADLIRFGLQGLWPLFWRLLVVAIAAASIGLFVPFASKILIDTVIPTADFTIFAQIALGLLVVVAVSFAFSLTQGLAILRLRGWLENRIQPALWDRLLQLPVAFFRRYTVGDLMQRIQLVEGARQVLSTMSVTLLLSGVTCMVYFFALFVFSWQLAIAALCVVFGLVIVCLFCLWRMLTPTKRLVALYADLNAFLVQAIGGIGKLRTAGAEKRAFCHWADPFVTATHIQLHIQRLEKILGVCLGMMAPLSLLVIFGIAAWKLGPEGFSSQAALTPGLFIAFLATLSPFMMSVITLLQTFGSLIPLIPLWARAKVVLDEPVEETSPAVGQQNLLDASSLQGEISMQGVSFHYPHTTHLLLKDVNLQVSPGQCIALVGHSGCGKSTILRLLLGFEEPDEGAISFDGISIKKLSRHQVRSQIGAVLQSSVPFSGTIRENILCGRHASSAQLEQALALSCFDEVLSQLPMGFETLLPTGGGTLSGGQRQRLMLARALVQEPKILLLDEATSALDNATRLVVMNNLKNLNVTRIMVAHRENDLLAADHIYVINRGTIVQQGSLPQLRQQEGPFKTLFQLLS